MRLWLLVVLLAGACRTSERWKPKGPRLPFHAALAPTVVEENDTSGEDGMRIAFEADEVSSILAERLEQYGFARVTQLAPAQLPSKAPEAGVARTRPRFDAAGEIQSAAPAQGWQDLALEAGADVLVSTLLVYEPVVRGRINEKFWLNLPLFLFGPLCYLVGDNTYEVEASLLAELYDVSQRRREVVEWELLRIPIQVTFAGTDLSFLRRSGGRLGSYALSLLVPVGLLARSSDHIASKVREAVLEELAHGLVRELHSRSGEIETGQNTTRPSVDAQRVRTVRQADGTLSVALPVFDPAFVARGWTLLAGTARATGEFDAQQANSSAPGEWMIEADLAAPADARYLRVAIEDGAGRVRRYTFELGPLPSSR